MKKFTFAILLSFLGIQMLAQGSWKMISPTPTINDFHDIHFVSEQRGWGVGKNGTIIGTLDGGETWNLQYLDDTKYFTGVFFIDENEGWVVGWHDVLHTENGGDAWEEQNLPGILDVEKVQFINHDTGWIVGTYKTIFKTVNGGQTWTTKLFGGYSAPAFNDLCFTDALHGVAVGGYWVSYENNAYAMVTSDGGETWTETTPENADELVAVSFISQDTGWACGYGNDILKTIDGGYTWQVVASMYNSKDDIHFFDANHGIILSGNDVLVTYDGGITWTTIQTVMSSSINCFSFSGSTGFAAGAYGCLFKTIDYGENWEPEGSQRFGAVDRMTFFDSLNGWGKFTTGSQLLHTIDGGYSWENVNIGASSVLADCCFPSTTTGYAIDYQNTLYKTADAGTIWEQHSIGVPGNYRFVYFIDEQKGFIGGNDGLLIKTEDGGESWSVIDISESAWFNEMQFTDEQNGWLLSYGGGVYSTTDGGETWEKKEIGGTSNYYDLCFLSPQKGFVACLTGKLFMTEDAGDSWEEVLSFSQSSNRAKIAFASESEGWLAVGLGLYYTIDGGHNWVYDSGHSYMLDIFFLDSETGWISGSNSLILKYDNQITDINETGLQTFKVFPNPASGKVTLSVPEIDGKHTLLNVYDLSGKLCRVLNLSNLTGKVTIDISAFPDGLYLFELKTFGNSKIVKVLKRN